MIGLMKFDSNTHDLYKKEILCHAKLAKQCNVQASKEPETKMS